jgi:hypothetical protein
LETKKRLGKARVASVAFMDVKFGVLKERR